MQQLLIAGLFFLTALPVLAAMPITNEPLEPYAVTVVTDSPIERTVYLGDLEEFPEMYEVSSESPFTLRVQMRQRDRDETELLPFSLIVVKQNEGNGGVAEVARFAQPALEWAVVNDRIYGMKFRESEALEVEVAPGTYRVEISTPNNRGAYELTIGEENEAMGYFESLRSIRLTQAHFDYSWLRVPFSSLVYLPLGIIIMLSGFYVTWRRRTKASYGH